MNLFKIVQGNQICNLFYYISAELYEISPYATFGGGAAAHSLQFRTLARRDDDAAPPHRRRRRACDHYRYGIKLKIHIDTVIYSGILFLRTNAPKKTCLVLVNDLARQSKQIVPWILYIIINMWKHKLFLCWFQNYFVVPVQ